MTSSQVKARFMSDHEELRGKVAVLEGLALGILRGDEELSSALRRKGEDLQNRLLVHMQWEEAQLLPMLRSQSQPGISNAETILSEHRRQRNSTKMRPSTQVDGHFVLSKFKPTGKGKTHLK